MVSFIKRYTVVFLFIIVFLVLFRGIILGEDSLLVGDNLVQGYPWLNVYAESLKSGGFPYWVEDIHCGFPMIAEGQVGGFYPLNLLFFLVLPFKAAYNFSILFHILMMAVSTYALARILGADEWGAALSSIILCFGSALANIGYHIAMIRTLAWVPLIILLFELHLRRKNIFYLILAAVAMGFQSLAGSVQMFFYGSLCYAAYYVFSAHFHKKDLIKTAINFIFASFVSIVFFLPQLVVTMRVISSSGRLSSPDFALWGSLNPASILTIVFPGIFRFHGQITTEDAFISCLALLFTITALRMSRKRTELKPLVLILGLSVFISLGWFNPLCVLLIKAVKFYTFRVPSRMIFFGIFSISLLSGIGFTQFFRQEEPVMIRNLNVFLWIILITGGIVGAGSIVIMNDSDWIITFGKHIVDKFIVNAPYHRYPAQFYYDKVESIYRTIAGSASLSDKNMQLSLLFAVSAVLYCLAMKKSIRNAHYKASQFIYKSIAVMLISVNLFVYKSFPGALSGNIKSFDAIDPGSSEIYKHLSEDRSFYRILPFDIKTVSLPAWSMPNTNMSFGIKSVGAYSPLAGGDYRKFLMPFQAVDDSIGVLHPEGSAFTEENVELLKMMSVKYVIAPYPLSSKFLKDIKQDKDGSHLYEIEGTFKRGFICMDKDGDGVSDRGVTVIKQEPGYAEFEVVNETGEFFVFSEYFYPGWSAYVDGQETEIKRFKDVLQMIECKKGKHNIVFKFYAEKSVFAPTKQGIL